MGDKGLSKFHLARCAQPTLTTQAEPFWLLNPGGHVFVVPRKKPSVHSWGLQVHARLVAVVFSGSYGPSLQCWKECVGWTRIRRPDLQQTKG